MPLSPAQVFSALSQGGLTSQSARTLTAIGAAESRLDPNAIGDKALENSKWGPSIGVFQIRTLKAETGRGTDRDIQRLQGNLGAQVQAAINISSKGTNFSPWTTYTSGSYKTYYDDPNFVSRRTVLDAAKGAAGDAAKGALGLAGIDVDEIVDGFKTITYKVTFAVLGLGLVGAGVFVAFKPQITGAVTKAAKVAAL